MFENESVLCKFKPLDMSVPSSLMEFDKTEGLMIWVRNKLCVENSDPNDAKYAQNS